MKTITGRELPPCPPYRGGSSRKITNDFRKRNVWLLEQAKAEAESRGDMMNATIFGGELASYPVKGKFVDLPMATKEGAALYLFDNVEEMF